MAQTAAQCERAAIHYEARGEGILTQRAVLEVVRTRAKAKRKSVCKVLLEKGQFPWATHKKLKRKLDVRQQARYDVVRSINSSVLTEDFIYFNNPAHPWGKETKRIGKISFSK